MGVLAYQLDGLYFGLTQTRLMAVSMVAAAGIFILLSQAFLVPALGMTGLWIGYLLFMALRTGTLAIGLPYLDRRVQIRARDKAEGRLQNA